MSHTRRKYNKPNRVFGEWVIGGIGWVCFWHPYKQFKGFGHSSWYGKEEHSKLRRRQHELELRLELRHLCEYEHFNECSKCCHYICDLKEDEVCSYGY